jgi:hypothetical protein
MYFDFFSLGETPVSSMLLAKEYMLKHLTMVAKKKLKRVASAPFFNTMHWVADI